jgi:hypothetical protein
MSPKSTLRSGLPVSFMPSLSSDDIAARHWLSQVTLRLRPEVCWLWRERISQSADDAARGALPPLVDRCVAALDLARYEHDKLRFFQEDPTFCYLIETFATFRSLCLLSVAGERRGSFGWVAVGRAASIDCLPAGRARDRRGDSSEVGSFWHSRGASHRKHRFG